jgi:predicted TIM-barrel enzyme
VGSGATPETLAELLRAGATGFIVGSWVQVDGRAGAGVDERRARRFVEAMRAATDP